MSKSHRKTNALLLLSSTVLTLLGVEAVFRIRHARQAPVLSFVTTEPSPNPVLMWRYKANATRVYGRLDARGQPIEAKMNRWGFRERDFRQKRKPNGTFRVCFIGDSVTEGLGVRDHEVFAVQFGEIVRRRGSSLSIEGLNFGVGGYNTLQVAELVSADVLAFEPDVVVYVLHLNDFDFDGAGLLVKYYKDPSSHFLEWMRVKLRPRQRRGESYYDDYYRINRDAVFSEIVRMKELLGRNDVEFVVALLPVFVEPVSPNEPHFDRDGFSERDARAGDSNSAVRTPHPYAHLHEAIGDFLNSHEIRTVDLLGKLRDDAALHLGRLALGDDPWHPNAEGHAAIATALYEAIEPMFPQ